nr:lipopolysaccharide biosynthesis protein [Pseudoalteromonas caenipelagi]
MKQASVLLGGNLSASVLNFLSVAVALKALGVESFGAVTLLQSYILVISLCFNPQAWQGLIRYLHLEKDKASLIKLTLYYDFLCAVLGTLLAVCLTDLYLSFFDLSEYSHLLKYSSLYILVNQTSVAIGVLRYHERYTVLALQSVISAVIFFVCALVGYWQSYSIEFYVISYLLSLTIGVIYIQLCSIQPIKQLLGTQCSKKMSNTDKGTFNKFNYTVHLTALADIPVKQLDNILVGAVVSVGAAGAYRVIKQIATISTKVTGPLNQVLYPEVSNLLAEKAYSKVRYAMSKLILFLLVPSLVVVLFATMTADYWILAMFSQELVEYKWHIGAFLIMHAVATAFTPIHPVFLALGYVKKLFYITLISNLVLCLAIVILGPYIELWGVLLAIFLQYFLTIAWKFPLILKRLTEQANESLTLHT